MTSGRVGEAGPKEMRGPGQIERKVSNHEREIRSDSLTRGRGGGSNAKAT